MAITRIKNSSIASNGPKYDNALAGLPYRPTIGTATDGGTGTTVSVAFTENNSAGAGVTYTALSTPGSLTGTGSASPVTVSGLTSGTAYTFQVKAGNSLGDSAYSASSNSVTPVQPTAFESIATATGTGSSPTITFNSIPSTFKHLQIRAIARIDAAGISSNDYRVRINGVTTSSYAYHFLEGNGSAVSASGSASQTGGSIYKGYTGGAAASNIMGVTIIDILDYSSSTVNKTIRAISGVDLNGSGNIVINSSLFISTAAITSIELNTYGNGNFTTASTFALYGIKEF